MLFSVNAKNISDKITCFLKKKKKKNKKRVVLEIRTMTDFQNLLKAIHDNLPPTAPLRGHTFGNTPI